MKQYFSSRWKSIVKSPSRIILRFPISFLYSVILLITSNYYNEQLFDHQFSTAVIISALFGWMLSFAITLFCENHSLNTVKKLLFQFFGIVLALGMFIFTYYQQTNYFFIYHLMLLIIAGAVFVLCFPFLGKKSQIILWDYHSRLFISLFFSFIFAAVFFVGLLMISLSLQYLFHLDYWQNNITYSIYLSFLFVLPNLFLSLIPQQWQQKFDDINLTKLSKILMMYILMPIVCIYGIILYIYASKILFTWELPQGQVAFMVLGFAIIGSIVWYMLLPFQQSKGQHWAKWYHRLFFIVLFPLMILLFTGLFRRLSDYGLTINRYLLLLIACWLTIVDVLFIFKKIKNINTVLCSLSIICLLLTIGPWSIISFPRYYQTRQFEKTATEYQVLKAGKIVASPTPLTIEQNRIMTDFINYLVVNEDDCHRNAFIEKYCDTSLLPIKDTKRLAALIVNSMNNTIIDSNAFVDEAHGISDISPMRFCSIKFPPKTYMIADYHYLFDSFFEKRNSNNNNSNIVLNNLTIEQHFDFSTNELQFRFPNSKTIVFQLNKPLQKMAVNQLINEEIPDSESFFYQENEQFGIGIAIKSVEGNFSIQSSSFEAKLDFLSLHVFVKDKR
ncbi:MAG: DUF4153 domain-containing protein [Bacteroidales bacterium]|nr:DUF4153 domain-containing protein [Bacteroidales bacterium]